MSLYNSAKPAVRVQQDDIVVVKMVDGLFGMPAAQSYEVHPSDPNHRHMVGCRVGSLTWANITVQYRGELRNERFGGTITDVGSSNYGPLPTFLAEKPKSEPRPKPEPETVRFFEIPKDPVLTVAATTATRPHRSHPAVRTRLG